MKLNGSDIVCNYILVVGSVFRIFPKVWMGKVCFRESAKVTDSSNNKYQQYSKVCHQVY
jgi:hypothetical protein